MVAIWLAICAVGSAGLFWMQSMQCEAAWSASGMRTEWGVLSGCLVEVSPGKFLPSKAIRDIEAGR